ncbi:MAG: hypothetical protein ACE5GL_04165 [Calditrichia bacterium]
MRSFTFNSKTNQHERAVPQQPWNRVALLLLIIVLPAVGAWEWHWRSQGYVPDYDNTENMWAEFRAKAEKADAEYTVILGSSRALFGIDLAAWRAVKGDDKIIQLAQVGSSPLPILKDLVENTDFAGALVVSVTPGLFFNKGPFGGFTSAWANSLVRHYHKWSPAQKMEHGTALMVEPMLAFVNQGALTLGKLVHNLPIPNRPDAMFGFGDVPLITVPEFANYSREREAKMTERMMTDTVFQWRVRNLWAGLRSMTAPRTTISAFKEGIRKNMAGEYPERTPMATWRPAERDSFYLQINDLVQAFKNRGGQLIFIRPPTAGEMRASEKHYWPREKYWERLLRETNCAGVHFEDYESLQGLELPEWSHIRADQAPVFTKALAGLVYEKLKQVE